MNQAVTSAILALGIWMPMNRAAQAPTPVPPAAVEPVPGQLEVEEGFVSLTLGPNWYQDVFGPLFEQEDKYHHRFVLASSWEKEDVLLIELDTWRESGTHPRLHIEISEGRVVRCWADGRWHGDNGSEPNDFAGSMKVASGFMRARFHKGKIACIFSLRGELWGNPKHNDGDERVMGGFEIELPAKSH